MLARVFPFLFIPLLLFLGGCAAVVPYEARSAGAYNQYAWGNAQEAAANYEAQAKANDGRREGLLWQLETAKAYQAAGNWEVSRQWFEQAEASIRVFEDEATVVARDVAAEPAAAFTNQSAIAYKGTYTDRILLNCYQAINYLMLRDVEAAAVETRRALRRQEMAYEVFRKDIQEDQREWVWGYNEASEEKIVPVYADVSAKVTPAAAQFVNPLAHWLRAVAHHIRKDYDRARQDVLQIQLLGEIVPSVQSWFADLEQKHKQGGTMEPYVFILFENGLGPTLREERVEMIVPKLGYTGVALPKPSYSNVPWSGPVIALGSENYSLDVIATTDALFSAEFRAEFPLRLTRIIASWAAKEAASRVIVEQTQKGSERDIAYVLTGLYKYSMNRADTRTWQTRGNQFHVAAYPLPENGDMVITIPPYSSNYGETQELILSIPLEHRARDHFVYIQGITALDVMYKWVSF